MGEWKPSKIGALAYGIRGVSYKPYQLKSLAESGDYLLLRSNNIRGNRINFDSVQIVPQSIVRAEQAARNHDIAVCMSNGSRALVGKSGALHITDEKYTVGAFCSLFRPLKGVDPVFVQYIFQSAAYKSAIEKALSGSAINNLHNRVVEAIEVDVPAGIEEQTRIASVLTAADEAIAASRALLEKFTAVKQGLMEDLLGNGQTVRLKDVCTVAGGSTPNTNAGKYWNGTHVWITPADLSVLDSVTICDSRRKLSSAGLRRATGRLLPAGAVILSCRAPVGYCAVAAVPFSLNQGCKALICHSINPMYLYYQLSRAKAQLENFSSGTTFLELPKRELERFEVHCPDLTEQESIAAVLTAADERLAAERKRLEKLEDLKRGLMDDLLTNRVSTDQLQGGIYNGSRQSQQ